MPPPSSDSFVVRAISGAGRGVVATVPIRKGVEVLACEEPVAHIIFREYRKEVCAQCFLYDRGRTLPVRSNDLGKVFCTQECCSAWTAHTGSLGLQAWRRLTEFVHTNSRHLSPSLQELVEGPRPTHAEIALAWAHAGGSSKAAGRKGRLLVDPDVLGVLLSAILAYHSRQGTWRNATDLVLDPEPYRSSHELNTHCQSFGQLRSMLPDELLASCTKEVCLGIVQAGSHNAFGIRSGGEDAEEYLGYAIYPQASYFNHSCAPNLDKERIGRTWYFYAQHATTSGEQLCISYLGGDEVDMSLIERRGRLQSVWGFICQCDRCTVEEANSTGS